MDENQNQDFFDFTSSEDEETKRNGILLGLSKLKELLKQLKDAVAGLASAGKISLNYEKKLNDAQEMAEGAMVAAWAANENLSELAQKTHDALKATQEVVNATIGSAEYKNMSLDEQATSLKTHIDRLHNVIQGQLGDYQCYKLPDNFKSQIEAKGIDINKARIFYTDNPARAYIGDGNKFVQANPVRQADSTFMLEVGDYPVLPSDKIKFTEFERDNQIDFVSNLRKCVCDCAVKETEKTVAQFERKLADVEVLKTLEQNGMTVGENATIKRDPENDTWYIRHHETGHMVIVQTHNNEIADNKGAIAAVGKQIAMCEAAIAKADSEMTLISGREAFLNNKLELAKGTDPMTPEMQAEINKINEQLEIWREAKKGIRIHEIAGTPADMSYGELVDKLNELKKNQKELINMDGAASGKAEVTYSFVRDSNPNTLEPIGTVIQYGALNFDENGKALLNMRSPEGLRVFEDVPEFELIVNKDAAKDKSVYEPMHTAMTSKSFAMDRAYMPAQSTVLYEVAATRMNEAGMGGYFDISSTRSGRDVNHIEIAKTGTQAHFDIDFKNGKAYYSYTNEEGKMRDVTDVVAAGTKTPNALKGDDTFRHMSAVVRQAAAEVALKVGKEAKTAAKER